MADVTYTSSDVEAATGVTTQNIQVGEAVLEGVPVYLKSDGKYYEADNSESEPATVAGVMLTRATGADQAGIICRNGQVDYGAGVFVAGEVYVLGDTGGAIMPASDAGSGDYTTILGIGLSTTVIQISLKVSGIVRI